MTELAIEIFVSDVAVLVKKSKKTHADVIPEALKILNIKEYEIERWADRRGFVVCLCSDSKKYLEDCKDKITKYFHPGYVGA